MTTENWQPASRYVAKEPSVWERIEDMYGKPFAELKAPEGWRFRMVGGAPEFRPIKEEEMYFPICGLRGPLVASCGDFPEPRLILEPIPAPTPIPETGIAAALMHGAPTPKRYVITLEETGEVRCPDDREPYVGIDGLPGIAIGDWSHEKRPILRVVSREAL